MKATNYDSLVGKNICGSCLKVIIIGMLSIYGGFDPRTVSRFNRGEIKWWH